METYVTGNTIKAAREACGLTQMQLAQKLSVSDKTVSKWETGRGYPDISLLEPLANALRLSVIELLNGAPVKNRNQSGNMKRAKWYVCPVCGNFICAAGEAVVSCCGITLPSAVPEMPDAAHRISIDPIEDEYFITLHHPMTKTHFIPFVVGVYDDAIQIVKLYPEGDAAARLKRSRLSAVLWYCNRDGLFSQKI